MYVCGHFPILRYQFLSLPTFPKYTGKISWSQIAQYEVYNYRRRQQHERLCFNDALLDQIADRTQARGDLLDAELDALKKCVQRLSASDRHLIQNRYSRKITSKVLAAELGRPANTV